MSQPYSQRFSPVMRGLSPIMLWGATLGWFAQPAQAACQRTAQPSITIEAPVENFAMQRIPGRQIAAALRDTSGKKVSGATFYNPQLTITTEPSVTNSGYLAECVDIAFLNIQLADDAAHFWVADELPPGSCIETELIAHEYKHIEVYREVYSAFPARAAPLVNALAAGYPALFNGGGAALVRSRLTADINRALNPLLNKLADEADARNRAIDNPAEYERIRASCGGSLNDYLRSP